MTMTKMYIRYIIAIYTSQWLIKCINVPICVISIVQGVFYFRGSGFSIDKY